ncbi:hypothetical protein ACFL02_03335, partial [Planctomycetota bacterium]
LTVAQNSSTNEVIIVVGAPGTDRYQTEFTQSLSLWQQACTKAQADSFVIGTDEEATDSDYEKLQHKLSSISKEGPTPLWIVLIGHGTFDGRAAKFNLRDKDISASELAKWLEPIKRPLAVINASSSSAPFINRLSTSNRVIVTATRSGDEQNYARFHNFFAAAVADLQADLDKDGQTSLLEAFLYANHGVAEFYLAAGRLATEHALIDDNGDGLGTRADWFRGIRPVKKARDDAQLDGYRAHQFHLAPSEFDKQIPPDLRQKRDQLELQVIQLRDSQTGPPDDAYFAQLESLLLQIAQIYDRIDKQTIFSVKWPNQASYKTGNIAGDISSDGVVNLSD